MSLQEGDVVYVENKHKLNRRKLDPILSGPFTVERKLSNERYELRTPTGIEEHHIVNIRRFVDESLPAVDAAIMLMQLDRDDGCEVNGLAVTHTHPVDFSLYIR